MFNVNHIGIICTGMHGEVRSVVEGQMSGDRADMVSMRSKGEENGGSDRTDCREQQTAEGRHGRWENERVWWAHRRECLDYVWMSKTRGAEDDRETPSEKAERSTKDSSRTPTAEFTA